MSTKEVISEAIRVLNASAAETVCNHETNDDDFDEARESVQKFASISAAAFAEDLGVHFACEAAMISLLDDIHVHGGADACLATIKELLSALQAFEQLPSRERLTLVKPEVL